MKLGSNEVYRSPGTSVDISFFSQNSVQRSGFNLQYKAGRAISIRLLINYCRIHVGNGQISKSLHIISNAFCDTTFLQK